MALNGAPEMDARYVFFHTAKAGIFQFYAFVVLLLSPVISSSVLISRRSLSSQVQSSILASLSRTHFILIAPGGGIGVLRRRQWVAVRRLCCLTVCLPLLRSYQ